MRLVCEECKKSYDYDVDDFCPRCGAYNQPPKGDGSATVWKDGINEDTHKKSFVHREVHTEQKKRIAAKSHHAAASNLLQEQQRKGKEPAVRSGISPIAVVVILLILLQLLRVFLFY